MKAKISGMRELERNLQRIEKRTTQNAVLRRSLKKAAEPMRAAAARNAPVDEGDLEASIKISPKVVNEVGRAAYHTTMRAGGTSQEAVAAMRTARWVAKTSGAKAHVELYMGPTSDVFYAKFREFGTRYQSPDPFMRPAFEEEGQATIDRLGKILRDEINKTISRISKR